MPKSASVPLELLAPPRVIFPKYLYIRSAAIQGFLFAVLTFVGLIAHETLESQLGLFLLGHYTENVGPINKLLGDA